MEKTYSPMIARFFEIVDYLLLIPATFGLILASTIPSWFTVIIWTIFLSGVLLLVGYFKHSRDRLNEKYVPALWIGTFFYNLIFLLLLFSLFVVIMLAKQSVTGEITIQILTALTLCAFWWLAAIALSALALRNFKSTQKYR
jgi:hypothetical protein